MTQLRKTLRDDIAAKLKGLTAAGENVFSSRTRKFDPEGETFPIINVHIMKGHTESLTKDHDKTHVDVLVMMIAFADSVAVADILDEMDAIVTSEINNMAYSAIEDAEIISTDFVFSLAAKGAEDFATFERNFTMSYITLSGVTEA